MATTQRLPLVELKRPVFESATLWQPGRSLQEDTTNHQHPTEKVDNNNQNRQLRTRDLRKHQPQQQPAGPSSSVTPRLQSLHYYQQLHREASQITMATVAMERQRRRRDHSIAAASASMELDGRHLSAVGQRRGGPQLESLPTTAATGSVPSPPPPPTGVQTMIAGGLQAVDRREFSDAVGPSSLPFVQRHLRRHRTLLELSQGQDRLVVDAFVEAPSPSERLAARMRACAGEPTRGQASILERQQRQQQEEKQQQEKDKQQKKRNHRRRLSRREKTAQTISRAILTYDRSL
uniref:Uncharacterized protein n=2 Tax=Macrostomum lignano TaxID=282301 RepID=A0A1I8HEZ6_9PLAT